MTLLANWTTHDTIATSIGLPICLLIIGAQIWRDRHATKHLRSSNDKHMRDASMRMLQLLQALVTEMAQHVAKFGKPAFGKERDRDLAFHSYQAAMDICYKANFYDLNDDLAKQMACVIFNAAQGEKHHLEVFRELVLSKYMPRASDTNQAGATDAKQAGGV